MGILLSRVNGFKINHSIMEIKKVIIDLETLLNDGFRR